jgi:hypothetical protein
MAVSHSCQLNGWDVLEPNLVKLIITTRAFLQVKKTFFLWLYYLITTYNIAVLVWREIVSRRGDNFCSRLQRCLPQNAILAPLVKLAKSLKSF